MVSHNIGSGDSMYQHTPIGTASGSEFEVIYWLVGIIVIVAWWVLDRES